MNVHLEIEQISELKWIGKIGNSLVCEFEYFKDETGRIWMNDIGTHQVKKKGYGTPMVIRALEVYKIVYVSTATQRDIKERDLPDDGRYSNEPDFWIFIKKCVDRGILKPEWIKHPFKND